MAITGKQLLLALEQAALCNSGGFVGPQATFVATPNSYTNNNAPAGVTLTGTITLNDAVISYWNIRQGGTILATGSTITPSFYVTPASGSSITYTLDVYYTLDGAAGILTLNAPVLVTDGALYGSLPGPTDDIILPTDLTAPIIAGLSIGDEATITALFPIVITVTARVVIVVPYGISTSWGLLDNDNFSVDSEFTFVDDPGNNQKIAVSNNPLIPGTYYFKVGFL